MLSPASFSEPSGRHLRVDPEHQILEMMKSAMSNLHHCQVDIRLLKGAVLLSGIVDSWSDKQTAQESIRTISGSRTIENNLRVL